MTQLGLKMQQLYEKDYVLWTDTTAQQLRQRELENLDWEHLIEEVEALGNEQRRKVESYLKQLIKHLLLYQYWETERAYCANGWKEEIENFRDELEFLLRSQTLYNYALQKIDGIYIKAKKQAIIKTDLPPETFSQNCPYTLEQILDSDFLPE